MLKRCRSGFAFVPHTLDALEARSLLSVSFDGLPNTLSIPANVGAPQSIVAADFDGDGQADLAVSFQDKVSAPRAGSGIAFYRGHGDGTFDAAVWTALGARAGNMAAVRFVGVSLPPGGGLNLVSVAGVGTDGQGGFARAFVRTYRLDIFSRMFVVESRVTLDPLPLQGGDPVTAFIPGGPVVGEFTGDGRTDVAFALNASGGRGIVVLDHANTGSLTVARTINTERIRATSLFVNRGVSDQPLTVGDLDADGRSEIVFRGVDQFYAVRGSASGLLASPVALGFASNIDWRFADIDGDARMDAVSTWIPVNQGAGPLTELVAFVRIKRGQGRGVGSNANTFFFGALERIATVSIGPRIPGGALNGAGSSTDRLGLLIGPDLDNDVAADITVYRDFSSTDQVGMRAYQRIETISTPPAPAAAPAWPAPVTSMGPFFQTGTVAFEKPLADGIPLLFDVTADGRGDLIQIINGRVEVRVNADV